MEEAVEESKSLPTIEVVECVLGTQNSRGQTLPHFDSPNFTVLGLSTDYCHAFIVASNLIVLLQRFALLGSLLLQSIGRLPLGTTDALVH